MIVISGCDRNLLYVLILFTAPVTVIIASGPVRTIIALRSSTKLTNTLIKYPFIKY